MGVAIGVLIVDGSLGKNEDKGTLQPDSPLYWVLLSSSIGVKTSLGEKLAVIMYGMKVSRLRL